MYRTHSFAAVLFGVETQVLISALSASVELWHQAGKQLLCYSIVSAKELSDPALVITNVHQV